VIWQTIRPHGAATWCGILEEFTEVINMSQFKPAPIAKNVVIIAPALRDPSEAPKVRAFFLLPAVLAPLTEKVFIITGNFFEKIPYDNVRVINVRAPMMRSYRRTLFFRAFRYLSTQITLSAALVRLSLKTGGNVGAVFILTGEVSLIIAIISKLLGKATTLVLRGSLLTEEQVQKDLFSKPRRLIRRFNLALLDRIITYSKGAIMQWDLKKYRDKVLVASYLFVDLNEFRLETPLDKRGNIVGYIGRLSPEKGIWNFIEAMPKLVEASPDVGFLIIGDGELQDRMEHYVNQRNLNNKVRPVGRVNHNEVPRYLNQLKLLVMPSYSEGLPNAVLEAMACGTPVLAAPVGSIPDVIADGETGFIMEDNSPECIASSVIRALNHPKLEKIARNAHGLVKKEFTYQAAVERYRDILANLNLKQ
jgi:glycosyltransferase involved in cell wall biosynthesis